MTLVMVKRWLGIVGAIAVLSLGFAGDRWQMIGIVGLVWLVLVGQSGWQALTPSQGNKLTAQRESLAQRLAQVREIVAEITEPERKQVLEMSVAAIADNLATPQTRVAIVGMKGVGKTAVVSALRGDAPSSTSERWWGGVAKGSKKITLLDTNTISGEIDQVTANSAELLVLVVSGDMTATEYAYLNQVITDQHQRVILAFNKSDLYLVSDQQMILKQLKQRCAQLIPEPDIVMITAKPRPIKVRQYGEDSNLPVKQWQEDVPPVIAPLKQRLEQVLQQEWEGLWLEKIQRQIEQVSRQAESALQEQRRKLAEAAIAKYQKIIALSVFASPLPTVDLAASLTLNVKLLLEIAQIYRQPLTFSQAQQIATDMVRQLVQFGGVELATSAIASFLKTNLITYAIGGVVQGVSAAYLSYICASSFISYLEQRGTAVSGSTIPKVLIEHQIKRLKNAEFMGQFVPNLLAGLHIPAASR